LKAPFFQLSSHFLRVAFLLSFYQMTVVNVMKQFYTKSHKLEPGSIGALPGRHLGSTGITRSVSVTKSSMVGMERDEILSPPGFIGNTLGKPRHFQYISGAISGTEAGIYIGSVGKV
jgi:hypothetical protein